jgi:Tfp pilus assembly protein PilX
MSRSPVHALRAREAGGITIVVTLMLLVLLTVAAMGMSKNALRDLAISGTTRQGSMARNTADSGVEWAVYWLTDTNAGGATGSAAAFRSLKSTLASDDSLAGRAYDPSASSFSTTTGLYNPNALPTPPTDLTVGNLSGTTQGFTVGLTRMGKLPITNISQGNGPAAYTPAQGAISLQAPDLWAVRTDSQVTVGTGLLASRFFHAKEAWVSTPVGN